MWSKLNLPSEIKAIVVNTVVFFLLESNYWG